MKSIFNSTTLLILGIILFIVGCVLSSNYDNAVENGYEVEATIAEVAVKNEVDSEGFTRTSYTIYADYEHNGREFRHIKIGKYYDTDDYYAGKVMKVVINPENPAKPMQEGVSVWAVGFIMVVGSVICKIVKRCKKNKVE